MAKKFDEQYPGRCAKHADRYYHVCRDCREARAARRAAIAAQSSPNGSIPESLQAPLRRIGFIGVDL